MHRFLRAFWITLGREFHAIDRLRLDKYLYLIRSYVGVAFQVFLKNNNQATANGANKKRKREETTASKKRSKSKSKSKSKHADEDEDKEEQEDVTNSNWADLQAYLDIITEGPLHPLNFDPSQPKTDEENGVIPMPHGPDGLRYHLLDIWIDEIEKALEIDPESGKPVGEVPMEMLLAPVERLKKESAHRPVRIRAGETLDDERLVEWGFKERKADKAKSEDEESEEEWGGFGDD